MKKFYRIIFELALIGALAFMIWQFTENDDQVIELKHRLAVKDSSLAELKTVNSEYEKSISLLQAQLADYRKKYFDGDARATLKAQGLKNPEEELYESLQEHKELIDVPGTLGGRFFFYDGAPLQYGWYMAAFEDGHRAGAMLLSYSFKKGHINWKVIDHRMD